MNEPAVRWTAKLPTLVVGTVLSIGSLIVLGWRKSRAATVIGVLMLTLGLGFIGYSMTIKNWCEVRGASAFSADFDPSSFSECLRRKAWWQP